MNKQDFIKILSSNLKNISLYEKNDIISDYDEHFEVAIKNGKTEEEIIKTLGDPIQIANGYLFNKLLVNAEEKKSLNNLLKIVFASFGLCLVNAIIFTIPLFFIILFLLIVYIFSFSAVLTGIFMLFSIFNTDMYIVHLSPFTMLCFSTSILCVGLLMCIVCFYLAKLIYSLLLKYFKFNLNIILGK